jgi:hypothetical protein
MPPRRQLEIANEHAERQAAQAPQKQVAEERVLVHAEGIGHRSRRLLRRRFVERAREARIAVKARAAACLVTGLAARDTRVAARLAALADLAAEAPAATAAATCVPILAVLGSASQAHHKHHRQQPPHSSHRNSVARSRPSF